MTANVKASHVTIRLPRLFKKNLLFLANEKALKEIANLFEKK